MNDDLVGDIKKLQLENSKILKKLSILETNLTKYDRLTDKLKFN